MTFTLKFERRFSMAHRLLSGNSSKCSIPHGHNEFVRISLICPNEENLDHKANMVTDFASAKKLWHKFVDDYLDHSFQLGCDDPIIDYFRKHEPNELKRIVITPGDPTTEIMCACLMSKLDNILKSQNSSLICQQLELEETPTNTVILQGINAYKRHLPSGAHWWQRGDFSINDF